ncbi:MAG: transposase [Anaerolineales bacterium]|nr:transposase [Anaerolineales bacterium]
MSSSQELYTRLIHTLRPLVNVDHISHLTNWVWIVVGILQARSIALSQIALHIPGDAKAESRVTTIRRWLKNLRVDVWEFYRPVLERALQDWRAVTATVILDGVMVFGDRWQIFRLSLAHAGRAIPLGWVVLSGKGLTQREKLETMLTRVANFLKGRVKRVVFLADRGFRDRDWAELCLKINWDYAIRVANNTYVTLDNGWYGSIEALGVRPGHRRYDQNVRLTQDGKLLTNLTVTWTTGDAKNPPELLAIISSQPAARARLREYARRMHTEEGFRDDKSGGFDMAHTRLQHAERLERLLLALAIAKLWCHELGEHVLAQGEAARRMIDPGPQRELSLFQLGLRWLKRCLSTHIALLPAFLARISPLRHFKVVRYSTS